MKKKPGTLYERARLARERSLRVGDTFEAKVNGRWCKVTFVSYQINVGEVTVKRRDGTHWFVPLKDTRGFHYSLKVKT